MRYTPDFKIRRRGLRTFLKTLDDGRRTHGLIAQYDLAVRAGKAIQRTVSEARLALDFSEGRRCRIEDETLVLLVDSAVQHNRLKNMRTRLLAAVMTKGLPITDIDVRLRSLKPSSTRAKAPEPTPIYRRPSIAGAAALKRAASEAATEDMKEVLTTLASLVGPTAEEAPIVLQVTVSEESERIAAGLQSIEELLPRLPQAPDERLIPNEADAEKDDALAAVRKRMLARLNVRRDYEAPLMQARDTLKTLAERVDLIAEDFFSEEPDHTEIESVYLEVRKAASVELARIAQTAERLTTYETELKRRKAEEEAKKSATASAPVPPTATIEQNEVETTESESDAEEVARNSARIEALVNNVKTLENLVKSVRKTLLSTTGRLQTLPKHYTLVRRISESAEEAQGKNTQYLEARHALERQAQTYEALENSLANHLAAAERTLELLQTQNKRLKSALRKPLKPESLTAIESIEHALPSLGNQIGLLDEESDTLADRVEVLENDFYDDDERVSRQNADGTGAQCPKTPEELALEAQTARLEHLLDSLPPVPDIRLVPDESAAADDPAIAALRLRLLAQWDARQHVNDLAAGAASLLEALRKARESGIGVHRQMLQAASCAVDETEMAAASLFAAHEASPDDLPERPATEEVPTSASVEEPNDADNKDVHDGHAVSLGRLTAAVFARQKALTAGLSPESQHEEALDDEIRTRLVRASNETEASFAQSLLADHNAVPTSELLAAIEAAIEKLAALPAKLPKTPDKKLVPSKEDAMLRPMLASLRARMLARLRKREAFEREIARLREELAETAEALADPLANARVRRLQAAKALAQTAVIEEMLDAKV